MGFEWLERRDLLSADPIPAVEYRLALYDTNDQPLPTDVQGNPVVSVGETFRLVGYNQDVTFEGGDFVGRGVFASYMDVFYTNAGRVMVRHGETQQLQFYPLDQAVGIAGTFTLTFDGHTTADIQYTTELLVLAGRIQNALADLPNIGPGNVRVMQAPAPEDPPPGIIPNAFQVDFVNDLGERDVPMLVIDSGQLTELDYTDVVELFPADLNDPDTFRNSFTAIDPFLFGLNAIDKQELDPGQPQGGRSFGGVGGFMYRFNSPNPSVEFPFFSVDLMAVAPGRVEFSGNVPDHELEGYEGTETLVFPTDPTKPKFVVAEENIHFLQTLDNPLVLVISGDWFVDNGDPGYAETGTWYTGGQSHGYQGDYRYAAIGGEVETATWTQVLPPATYEVLVTHFPFWRWSDSAPFSVYDGETPKSGTPVQVNQTVAPSDRQSSDGQWWTSLGEYTIANGSVQVKLTVTGDGDLMMADGVWIRYLGPVTEWFVDNGDPGYAETGTWYTGGQPYGYQGDYRYAVMGGEVETATWTQALDAGSYEILVTHFPFRRWSDSAPFSVYDGEIPKSGTPVQVNQTVAPSDRQSSDGQWWTSLGGYTIANGSVKVELTVTGVGDLIMADAVWIRYLGPVTEWFVDNGDPGYAETGTWYTGGQPYGYQGDYRYAVMGGEVETATWTQALDAGSYEILVTHFPFRRWSDSAPFSVYDGETPKSGTPVQVNQTVAPSGRQSSDGQWWTSLGGYTIANGSVKVELTVTGVGDLMMADAVWIRYLGPVTEWFVDNGDPGYAETGTWYTGGQPYGYQGDYRYAVMGAAVETATWTQGLAPGSYEVLVSHFAFNKWSDQAPFRVYDGGALASGMPVLVNQRIAPSDRQSADGQWWTRLGEYAITSGSVTVELTVPDGADLIMADGVWIRYVGAPV